MKAFTHASFLKSHQLAAHVHPADWRNTKPASRYNLVVIAATIVAANAGDMISAITRTMT
jgi:hypothetical protein